MSLQHLDSLLTYGGLVTLATSSVYFGSLGSYKPPKQKKSKPAPGSSADTDSDSEDEEIAERLSASDAIWFPLIGSVVLGGFYLAFKYFGDDWINKLMGYYFLVMGVGCVWKCLASVTKQALGARRWRSTPRYRLRLQKGEPLLTLRLPTLLLFPLSLLPSLSFFFSKQKSALMTDILALSFAHSALSTLQLDSLRTGCVLLGGLFFYDIWWVFGTSVMVTVATSLDVPIKLLFPRSLLSLSPLSLVPPPSTSTMLLGLGDVVIPGTLVALAYRLDMHLKQTGKTLGGSAGYFRATLVGYFVGLSMAFAAMHTFKAAQPALLYLSPLCCLSFVLNAVLRGELGYVWTWEDGADEGKEKENKEKEKEKEGKDD